jgi:glycerophosphoryl diester phosphodiesterase
VVHWGRVAAPHGLPPLYAHRLGRAYGPDSSELALRGALGTEVSGLETDICVTADGELLLLHDPLLSIGTTLDGWAHERSAAAICAGRLLDGDGEPTGERPLRLDELIEMAPADLTLQVEVKAHADRSLALRTAEVLCGRYKRHPVRPRIELLSFVSDACALAAAHGFAARLVAWADYTPDALAAWAVRTGVRGVALEHFLLSPRVVACVRLAGLSLTVGTVNRVELLERVLRHAPDAICTDRPRELAAEWERHTQSPAAVARAA